MPTYRLNVEFDDKGLDALSETGQKVTIVKEKPSARAMSTVWITFHPQESNMITWTEHYSVFASTTNIHSGAIIATSSHTKAKGGNKYILNKASFFDPGVPAATAQTNYEIYNQDPTLKIGDQSMMTCGLMQVATIGGNKIKASPMCAAKLLYNDSITFTPIEKIKIFTSSYSDNGIVISTVVSSCLTVDYTTDREHSVKFNDQSHSFVLL